MPKSKCCCIVQRQHKEKSNGTNTVTSESLESKHSSYGPNIPSFSEFATSFQGSSLSANYTVPVTMSPEPLSIPPMEDISYSMKKQELRNRSRSNSEGSPKDCKNLTSKLTATTLRNQPIIVFGVPWDQNNLFDLKHLNEYIHSIDDIAVMKDERYWTRLSTGDSDNLHPKSTYAPPTEWTVVVVSRLSQRAPYAPQGFPMGFSTLKLDPVNVNRTIEEHVCDIKKLCSNIEDIMHPSPLKPTPNKSKHVQPETMPNEPCSKTVVRWDSDGKSELNHFNKDGSVNAHNPPNILIRNESYSNIHDNMIGSSTRVIEAIVSSDSGMIISYKLDGKDVFPNELNQHYLTHTCSSQLSLNSSSKSNSLESSLSSHDNLQTASTNIATSSGIGINTVDCHILPSRLQLHRAPIDNDRFGFVPKWDACGFTKDLVYNTIPVHNSHSSTPNPPELLLNKELNYDFSSLSVRMIEEDIDFCSVMSFDKSLHGGNTAKMTAIGIEATIETKPLRVDKTQIGIMQRIHTFVQTPTDHHLTLLARNSKEETFIHQIAAAYRLSRESIRPIKPIPPAAVPTSPGKRTIKKPIRNPIGIQVKLIKDAVKSITTTTSAELLAIGPLGVPQEDEIPTDNDNINTNGNTNTNAYSPSSKDSKLSIKNTKYDVQDIILSWRIRYLMSPTGGVI